MKVFALIEPGVTGRTLSAMLTRQEAAFSAAERDPGLEIVPVRSVSALEKRLERIGQARPYLLVPATEKSLGAVAGSVERHRIQIISVASDEELSVALMVLRASREPEKKLFRRAAHVGRSGRAGHAVRALHDAESGRLNAQSIAAFFGISLRRLAHAISRAYVTVHKTPDAPGLQEALKPYALLVAAALRLMEDQDAFRVWLNAPHPDLDNVTPLELVEAGDEQVVLDLLEDALLGHPA